ncbi:hypothetical protein V8E53_001624 [Lactarius tabidus]
MHTSLVQDLGPKHTPHPPLNNSTSEQAFLVKNYSENTRRANRDPRNLSHSHKCIHGAAAALLGTWARCSSRFRRSTSR